MTRALIKSCIVFRLWWTFTYYEWVGALNWLCSSAPVLPALSSYLVHPLVPFTASSKSRPVNELAYFQLRFAYLHLKNSYRARPVWTWSFGAHRSKKHAQVVHESLHALGVVLRLSRQFAAVLGPSWGRRLRGVFRTSWQILERLGSALWRLQGVWGHLGRPRGRFGIGKRYIPSWIPLLNSFVVDVLIPSSIPEHQTNHWNVLENQHIELNLDFDLMLVPTWLEFGPKLDQQSFLGHLGRVLGDISGRLSVLGTAWSVFWASWKRLDGVLGHLCPS